MHDAARTTKEGKDSGQNAEKAGDRRHDSRANLQFWLICLSGEARR